CPEGHAPGELDLGRVAGDGTAGRREGEAVVGGRGGLVDLDRAICAGAGDVGAEGGLHAPVGAPAGDLVRGVGGGGAGRGEHAATEGDRDDGGQGPAGACPPRCVLH